MGFDWITFFGNIISKAPLERLLVPAPDPTKALTEFAKTMPAVDLSKIKAAPVQAVAVKERPVTNLSGLSTPETVAYQNREIGKQLVALESHYAQRMRIAGRACDCGSTKHLLYLEQLCQETIPMVPEPALYQEILNWVRVVEPKSSTEAAASGRYDEEYPHLSKEARELRKKITGTTSLRALMEPKGELSLEEAKKLAAQEAEREVERQWH